MDTINWTDPTAKVSKYFTVKEALWLPQWNRLANEQDGLTEEIKTSLKTLFNKMDTVREYFGKPIKVHVCYRPEEYNKLVHGAKGSAHKVGMAVDFDVVGIDCDKARDMLLSVLDQWKLRMEDNGVGSSWVHLDTFPVPANGHRFFKP